MTEYTSNPAISLYLCICGGGSRGEARRALQVKKIAEGRKFGRASKITKKRPPLWIRLPTSSVSCRMISMQFSSLLTEVRRLAWPAEKCSKLAKKSSCVVSVTSFIFFILYVKPIRSSLLTQRTPAGSSFRLHA